MLSLYSSKTVVCGANYPRSDLSGGNPSPERITVVQRLNRHDVFLIEHTGRFEYLVDTLRSGSPVQVMAAVSDRPTSWFGYVDSVTTSRTDEAELTLVTAVGATYPMKRTRDVVIPSRRADDTIARYVGAAGLVPLVSQTSVSQQVVQSGRSDFSVVRSLAEDFGMHLFVTGTTVNVLTVDDMFRFYGSMAPVLRWTHRVGERSLDPSVLERYEPEFSDNNANEDGWNTRTRAYGVSPDARISAHVSGSGMFTNYVSKPSHYDAMTAAKGEGALDGNLLSHRATISGYSNLSVRPGQPVYVLTPSGGAWWVVVEARHVLVPSAQTHSFEAVLGRNEYFPDDEPDSPSRCIERDLVRCFCNEYRPVLAGGREPVVKDFGRWGDMDRWRAAPCQH